MSKRSEIQHLIAKGAFPQAVELLSAQLQKEPNDMSALRLRAEVEFRRGNREAGFSDAVRAVQLNPADVSYGLDCAYNLLRAGRRDDALTIAGLVAAEEPTRADHRDALGTIFTHCERPDAALRHFEYACENSPTSAGLWFNLASAQRMVGNTSGAESSLTTAIKLDASDGGFFLSRSQLRRQTPEQNHVEELRAVLAQATGDTNRVLLGYALAKELEDLGRFQESFEFLRTASKVHRSRLQYDPAQELDLLKRLRNLAAPSNIQTALDRSNRAGPIFVLGLPRSGTTLVERIIASTGKVASAGEPSTLSAELWREAARHAGSRSRTETVIRTIEKNGSAVARAYTNLLASRFAGERFVDKTLDNYLYASLIREHVAGARMICLRRNPMDTCYSMYKMIFFGVYDFTYDLDELADYFIAWDQLITHWETVLGDSWLTVDYETLVYEPEPTMRRIIDHCGLEWTEDCLRFHELATPVTSASAGQVNSPLNDRSIGLWRRYSDELSALANRLRAAGIDF